MTTETIYTTTIQRTVFVPQARNTAKYGADAPREGFIRRWTEEVEEPTTQAGWDALEEAQAAEAAEAEKQAADWLGR